nr:hypothetical protein [Tanacetum cinerariifolium]
MMNMLNNKCRTSFTKPEFLKKAQRANPHLYDIGCYNDNLVLMLAPDSDEVIRLKKESRSKLSDLIRLFDYTKLNNLCLNEEMVADLRYFNSLESKVDSLKSQLESQKTQFLNEIDQLSREYYYAGHMNAILGVYTELDEDLKAQLQDKGIVISELKKLIEKLKGKSVDTKFEKSSVIRQPNVFKSQRPSVLGKPTTFSNSFNTNVLAPGMYKLHTDHTQTITSQLPQDSRKTNKCVSFSTRVIPTTSVSRPQLKSNPHRDRVMHNNSQGKKQAVKDHHRSVKLSKNKTFVTACNNSLNTTTLNVKSMCATCDTCVLIDKHNMHVLKSVAKPLKETVASESNKKPRNFTRKLYERVSKTCSWWYPKFTPSGYKWKPKSEKENFNPNASMPLGNASRTANVMDTMTSRRSTVSNTPLYSNSFVARRDCPIHRTVKFRNDQIAPILGYGDLVQGAVTIKRVYYVEGLNHNLFFVSQFYDAVLEVAFRKSTCFIRDLKGNDLLTGSRGTDLYSITLQDTNCPNPICLMAKATSSQAWLWHRRLSHLNFDTINLLSKNDIVVGLPKLKFVKYYLCSSCELRKAKRKSFTPNLPQAQKDGYNFYTWTYVVLCGDGENLDKMKEKGDECIFVGYSNQSKAYRVFNKRTRVIMESIHVNFDELPQIASDQISSDPAPECQTMTLNHDSLSPANQRKANVSQTDRTVTTSNELDLLFSLMFDELLNGSSKVVSKSFTVSAANAPNQRQHHTTPLNNHTTHAPSCQVSTLAPIVTSSENINQAKTYAENDQVADDEFINIFSTPVQDQGETSLSHVDSLNMHTFYQRYPSKHRWTKDHPLEQVIGNPSQSVRTRRQLESDAEMCMFVLTVSRTEPKNIKEAMADSAWIELMQEELHQFDRSDVWELVDRPLCTNVINLKWLWKNKRDEE